MQKAQRFLLGRVLATSRRQGHIPENAQLEVMLPQTAHVPKWLMGTPLWEI